jgi:hypothetical protein
VDVSTPFIQAQKAFLQKQEAQKVGQKPLPILATPSANTGGKKVQATPQPVIAAPPKVEKSSIQTIIEKDPIVLDYENMNFADIQAAVDFVYINLSSLDNLIDLKRVNDGHVKEDMKQKLEAAKLAAAAPKMDAAESLEENLDFKNALEVEEKILRARIERIKARAMEHLKSFRNKAYHVYINLDEWVTQRFIAEIQAVKDLVNIVKETIEAEQKLPNKLLLVGDKVHIDFSRLVIEPEIEIRAKSPIQPQSKLNF